MQSAFVRNFLALACSALLLAGCNKAAQPIEASMVANGDEWPSWGRTGHETHYSPLDEIGTGNVADLKLAWHFDLEPGFTPSTPLEAEGKVFPDHGPFAHPRARCGQRQAAVGIRRRYPRPRDLADGPVVGQQGHCLR
ncbi:hypothetical protein [Novosphingobium sp. G106]|uniref:hypothetical protein n=1 Tax=Novosphingobium sp. G106 TaxID=2849500 RepID=UPI0020C3CD1F|nr:hypothetical protein [Novosphingobium sp. G106]